MNKGFILKRLLLTGQKVEPAIVEFKKGLNVISGPSNTGKTFIFECIDFMMGAKSIDRRISESREYDKIFLEIKTNDKYFTLERSINGGDFILHNSRFDSLKTSLSEELSSIHSKENESTISAFFLKLNNIWNKEIRTNSKGKKRTMSYRDICHLLLISETEIIKNESPILSSIGPTNKTVETNIVKFIVTGNDDNIIISSPTENAVFSKKGKIELLTQIITNISEKNPKLSDYIDLESQIEKIDIKINAIKENHSTLIYEFNEIDIKRKLIASELLSDENKINSLNEVLIRSVLLKDNYNVDIKRLNSTMEAGVLLSDNKSTKQFCPYCNNEIKKVLDSDEIMNTVNACEREIEKINRLLKELDKSVELLSIEKKELETNIESKKQSLIDIKNNLEENLNLKLKTFVEELEILNEEKNSLQLIRYQENSINEFNEIKNNLTSSLSIPKENYEFDTLTSSTMQPICDIVLNILIKCNYPNLNTISFSEKTLDLVINGQDRKLLGKGLRAITYASFILALTEYTYSKDYRIGIPMFDSPLITYAKPKAEGEGISEDLAMDFYRYCANLSICSQIIIIENIEPPSDIKSNINHILFTGLKERGRKGFIPTK